MSNVPQTQQAQQLVTLLKNPSYSDRFKEVLKDRAPQFISSILQAARSLDPECDPKSIISSAMQAAIVDLPIDKNLGFAGLVPYRHKGQKLAQFQIFWKGYVQLAQRSGQYKNISVPKGINAEAFKGYDSIGVPIIDWNLVDETKEPVGYAFGWRLVNGGESIFFWPIEKILAHAKRYSQAYRSGYDSPWKTHLPEMCKKTVVKNSLAQFGILSIQMQQAVSLDSTVTMDIDSDPVYVDNQLQDPAPEDKPALVDDPVNQVDQQQKQSGTKSPNNKLSDFMDINGITWDEMRKMLRDYPDIDSIPSVFDMSPSYCEKLLENPKALSAIVKAKAGHILANPKV